jgi:hypothetical protein
MDVLQAKKLQVTNLYQVSAITLVLSLAFPAFTQAAGVPVFNEATLDSVVVTGNGQDLTGLADSASEGTITAKQLKSRP